MCASEASRDALASFFKVDNQVAYKIQLSSKVSELVIVKIAPKFSKIVPLEMKQMASSTVQWHSQGAIADSKSFKSQQTMKN